MGESCLDFSEQIENDRCFLERVIAGNECWIFENVPETKHAQEKPGLRKRTITTRLRTRTKSS